MGWSAIGRAAIFSTLSAGLVANNECRKALLRVPLELQVVTRDQCAEAGHQVRKRNPQTPKTSSKIQNPIRIVRLHPQSRIEAWSLKII
jgi:hypothetical protein